MKKKDFKELLKNKYFRALLFFGCYALFFAFVFAVASPSNETKNNAETKSDMWSDINKNYEYLYEVQFNHGQVISLEGKKYNNKNLFVKKINSVVDSQIYVFYNEMYKKTNDSWSKINDFVLINDTFDNNLLEINNIKKFISDAELMGSITNFDDSKTDTYTYDDLSIIVTSASNEIKKIILSNSQYIITMQYKNINKVVDFVVEK